LLSNKRKKHDSDKSGNARKSNGFLESSEAEVGVNGSASESHMEIGRNGVEMEKDWLFVEKNGIKYSKSGIALETPYEQKDDDDLKPEADVEKENSLSPQLSREEEWKLSSDLIKKIQDEENKHEIRDQRLLCCFCANVIEQSQRFNLECDHSFHIKCLQCYLQQRSVLFFLIL
jgi:hypothetical protein